MYYFIGKETLNRATVEYYEKIVLFILKIVAMKPITPKKLLTPMKFAAKTIKYTPDPHWYSITSKKY